MMYAILRQKCVEPQKRMVGGNYDWAVHRFPIKGGITLRDVFIAESLRPNPLLRMVKIK